MSSHKKFNLKKITNHARLLRKDMTDSEKVVWEVLRNRKFYGLKFLRQYPVLYNGNLFRYNYFIADFYCAEKNAIIEIDGPIHDKKKEYDLFRNTELENIGYRILHIKNEELNDMPATMEKLRSFLKITDKTKI